ncbi:MAG: hypothetical protein F6K11_37410 [Leptolyngbya sp. SIO3F4]|nr:hypothetical protein [Leptolyngbya sp. SIO3F4]
MEMLQAGIFEISLFNDSTETRDIRETIYGNQGTASYWELATNKETLPSTSTWMVMTRVDNLTYKRVGDSMVVVIGLNIA